MKSIRIGLKMTQAEFALLFGVHAMTVSKWERGVAGSDPTTYQNMLAKALARSPDAHLLSEWIVCYGPIITLSKGLRFLTDN